MHEECQKRVQQINLAMEERCRKTGRSEEIKIVGVTKNRTIAEIEALLDCGIIDIGENKVQELLGKVHLLPRVRWHFIGRLQRNKVRHIVRLPDLVMVHSVGSLRLAEKISEETCKANKELSVLLQLNIAEEETKGGFNIQTLEQVLPRLNELPGIIIEGLMTMAPYVEDPEEVRPIFREVKRTATKIEAAGWSKIKMKELSMGMTQDYLVAVEEGATIVRLGRALFS